jgi:hypothetical protein
MRLQALTARRRLVQPSAGPTTLTHERIRGVEEEQGEATANGANRVTRMFSLSALRWMDEELHGSIRPFPVLVAKLALPVSVLAQYTNNHGSFTDDCQADWYTRWHTAWHPTPV